jgi:hypothetical protein
MHGFRRGCSDMRYADMASAVFRLYSLLLRLIGPFYKQPSMEKKGKITAFDFFSLAIMMAALVFFSISANATSAEETPPSDQKADPDNYCYQQKAWDDIEKLRQEAPNDPLVIRMYAMRKGLCMLIEEGKIPFEQGIEIFELERSRTLIERQQEETRAKRKVSA